MQYYWGGGCFVADICVHSLGNPIRRRALLSWSHLLRAKGNHFQECGCFFRPFTQLHSTLKLKAPFSRASWLSSFSLLPCTFFLCPPAQNLLSSCCLGGALTGPSEASSSASPTALEVLPIFQGTNLFHPLGSMGLISHKNPCPILRRAPAPSQTTIF